MPTDDPMRDPWLKDIVCDHCLEILHVDVNGYYVADDDTSDCREDPRGHTVDGYERAP